MKSEALVFVAPHQMEVRTISVPKPGRAQVLIAAKHSCMSPGTEARVLAGTQVDMPSFPVVPGYSAAGIVEKAGPHSTWEVGQRVFYSGAKCADYQSCWGAHQRHVVLDHSAVFPIPAGIDSRAACCAKLAAIAEHGQRLANVETGDKVAVLGLGPIGFFAALSARARGARVAVSDLRSERRQVAEKLGFEIMNSDSGGYDVVVDATGAAAALGSAVALLQDKPWDNTVRPFTRLLIQGNYANPPALPYDELFLKESIVLVPRDSQRRDVEAVLQHMAEGLLPSQEILEDFGAPTNAEEAYRSAAEGKIITGYFSWD